MKVESHIESLLYRYDCVIIPGFGGFVINPKGAAIREGADQFHPPAREITFNQNLTRNDGLLADAIAAQENIAYDVAVERIDAFNKENLANLLRGVEVEFNGVGKFNQDSAGVLAFQPDSKANFLRASFGLSSFHSPAIKRDTVERAIEKKILKALPKEVTPAATSVTKQGINIIKYWPAAAVILLMIVASTWLLKSDVLENISVNYSDLNPFAEKPESVYNTRPFEKDSETVVPEEKDEIDIWLESIPKEPIVKPDVVKVKVVKRFHVIGGCFEFKANADKLMRRLKRQGFDPQLAGKNGIGLQRVAFGSYETRAEAKKVLRDIKRNHLKSAWLYVSRK